MIQSCCYRRLLKYSSDVDFNAVFQLYKNILLVVIQSLRYEGFLMAMILVKRPTIVSTNSIEWIEESNIKTNEVGSAYLKVTTHCLLEGSLNVVTTRLPGELTMLESCVLSSSNS